MDEEKEMKVLVTGASGKLAPFVVQELLNPGKG
jgi:uncharacterized protein YbjT (DUF2867 family)